ncbi:uncharacterized protein [Primulina huaijiensis]|uniref:uncharacterized protein n=1 Tax=Primulina huaijiensis TaxID=1492673 RepID=UPI003CC6FEBE
MSTSPSTRWCPTPEQLMILEELYRRGLRTPNSSQIQKITAHLSFYGKIQGKNVFYWFQNHKARDRQKLRKKLHQQHLLQLRLYPNYHQHHQQTQLNLHGFRDVFQLSDSFSAQNLHQQVGASGDVAAKETPRQTWITDLPKDCMMRTYGQDSSMDAGSTHPCCRNRPLQTLELFPLISPYAKQS